MKIYVASSWRNIIQPIVVGVLRSLVHDVYDFRNPAPGNKGFAWSDIDPDWQQWTPEIFRYSLKRTIAEQGFALDWNAMREADAGVLVLPCGRSAHIEAGYFVGALKPLVILIAPGEPELMYKMATAVAVTIHEVVNLFDDGARRLLSHHDQHLKYLGLRLPHPCPSV
jgi:nucleoside 2-deoxyribosyltransferase